MDSPTFLKEIPKTQLSKQTFKIDHAVIDSKHQKPKFSFNQPQPQTNQLFDLGSHNYFDSIQRKLDHQTMYDQSKDMA